MLYSVCAQVQGFLPHPLSWGGKPAEGGSEDQAAGETEVKVKNVKYQQESAFLQCKTVL